MVTDSRPTDNNDSIRRRRFCQSCGHRWSTWEVRAYQAHEAIQLHKKLSAARRILRQLGISIDIAIQEIETINPDVKPEKDN